MSAVEIHSSNLAGSWYPADPEELRADIERFLGEERRPDPALRAILVPHGLKRLPRIAFGDVGEGIALPDQAREFGQRITTGFARRVGRIISGEIGSFACVFSHTHTATGPLNNSVKSEPARHPG